MTYYLAYILQINVCCAHVHQWLYCILRQNTSWCTLKNWHSTKPCNPQEPYSFATNAKYMSWALGIATSADEDVWGSGGNDQCILELGTRPIALQFLRSGAKDGEASAQSCSFRERPLICILGRRALNWPAACDPWLRKWDRFPKSTLRQDDELPLLYFILLWYFSSVNSCSPHSVKSRFVLTSKKCL